jgi:glutamate decarboxylase
MKLLSSSNGAISVVAPEQRVTLYDEFNIEVPLDEFSEHGMSAKGRAILVHSHCRIDALLNLSSVGTTYVKLVARGLAWHYFHKNFADPIRIVGAV